MAAAAFRSELHHVDGSSVIPEYGQKCFRVQPYGGRVFVRVDADQPRSLQKGFVQKKLNAARGVIQKAEGRYRTRNQMEKLH